MKNFSFRFLSPCKGLCHSIGITVFALISAFAALESCKKTEAVETSINSSQKPVVYEGDEYDQGLVTEDPEEVEEPDEIEYVTDAAKTKVVSVVSEREAISIMPAADTQCLASVKKYCTLGGNIHVTLSKTDTIVSVTTNNPQIIVEDIWYENGTWTFTPQPTANWTYDQKNMFKKNSVKFTLKNKKGESISFSKKCINGNEEDQLPSSKYPIYGSSRYGAYIEFYLTHTTIPTSTSITPIEDFQPITSSFAANKGVMLFYDAAHTKVATILTDAIEVPATSKSPKKYKFKIVEWNGKCNGRRNTKSVSVTDLTKIPNVAGTAFATSFYEY